MGILLIIHREVPLVRKFLFTIFENLLKMVKGRGIILYER